MKATTLPTLRERWTQLHAKFAKGNITIRQRIDLFSDYVEFIVQNLALWMFVATNEKGEVMDKPEIKNYWEGEEYQGACEIGRYENDLKEYQEALDACIFEGWELQQVGDTSGNLVWTNLSIGNITIATAFKTDPIFFQAKFKSIEDLITAGIPLTLKPNHAKELGL